MAHTLTVPLPCAHPEKYPLRRAGRARHAGSPGRTRRSRRAVTDAIPPLALTTDPKRRGAGDRPAARGRRVGRGGAGAPATAAPSVGAIPAGGVLELQVAGRAGVPADAVAVVLNVTVTNPARPVT